MLRLLLPLLTAMVIAGVEPPPVPDPFGLGERLALIDHLRDQYRREVPAGVDLATLRTWYAEAWLGTQQQRQDPLLADELQRLRSRLLLSYGIDAPEDSDRTFLLALLRNAEASQAQAIAAHLADFLARGDDAPVQVAQIAPAGPVAPTTPVPVPEPSRLSLPPAANPGVWRAEVLQAYEPGIRMVIRWHQGDRGVLCVQFGDPGAVDFDFACRAFAQLVANAPADVQRAVFLIGHGGGVTIGDADLKRHLTAHRERYETIGGALSAKPIDCLVVASCSKGGSVQMRTMRDALGYWPLRRVCTGHRTYANLPTVIAASAAVLSHTGKEPFRGSFRWNDFGIEAASTGEVSDGAKSGNLQVFRVGVENGQLKVTEQR